ncbi:MAG: NAD(P)/FAD-dependent oxidoreductase [bacterium]
MPENNIKNIVIIGAGPAGASVAIQLKKAGIEPFLIDSKGYAGGLIENAYKVQNYIGLKDIKGKSFSEKIKNDLESFNIKIKHANISEIKKSDKDHFIVTTSSENFNSKIIVLAVGTSPKTYEPIDNDLRNKIFYDLVTLQKHDSFNIVKHIIIIGGGESAFDYALSLSDLGKNVLVLVRNNLSKVRGILKDEVEKNNKIKIIYNVKQDLINKYIRENDLTLSAIGRKSALDNIKLGFELPHPNVYVIGDAAHGALGQTAIASGEGIACANSIINLFGDKN